MLDWCRTRLDTAILYCIGNLPQFRTPSNSTTVNVAPCQQRKTKSQSLDHMGGCTYSNEGPQLVHQAETISHRISDEHTYTLHTAQLARSW